MPTPSPRQIERAHVQEEHQQGQHEAQVAERSHNGLNSIELIGLDHDELPRVLHDLAVAQGRDPFLGRGKRGVELLHVRLAGILEHGGDPVLARGHPGVEIRQPGFEPGEAILER